VRKKASAFPVGLYGMLLGALCWLTLPHVFAPVERWLVGGAALLARTWAAIAGEPAMAASPTARQRLLALGDELAARVRTHDLGAAHGGFRAAATPVHCRVIGIEAKPRGGAGGACELRLDHSYAQLADCQPWLTKADALVGFLAAPGRGSAIDDEPSDPARVMMTHHPLGPPLHAEMATADGGWLRFVVRAAATVDPAPLRVDLWDDPYRAARLERAGLAVRTRELVHGDGTVPGGLVLGNTRIWGYTGADSGAALTLGVFVVPPLAAGALSHVVAWRGAREPADGSDMAAATPAPVATVLRPGVVHDLPGALHGRHLLVGVGDVPDGAAVVQDGYLLGTARGLAFGAGLVTSFGASRHRWSLLLLPDDERRDPIELQGEVVRRDGGRVVLRCRHIPGDGRLPAGHLFSGSNGRFCPSGLWIGRAEPDPTALDGLLVTVPHERGVRAVEVHTLPEAP
jgi:hypothetical protein